MLVSIVFPLVSVRFEAFPGRSQIAQRWWQTRATPFRTNSKTQDLQILRSRLSQRWQPPPGAHESTCGMLVAATRFGQPVGIRVHCTRQSRKATVAFTLTTACPGCPFAFAAALHPLSRAPERRAPLRVHTCAARVLRTQALYRADFFRHACALQPQRTRPATPGCQGPFRNPVSAVLHSNVSRDSTREVSGSPVW